jgi:hypothetical protein
MYASNIYSKKLKAIRKKTDEVPEEQLMARVRDAFFSAMGNLPDRMKHDLFNSCVERYVSEKDRYKSFFEMAYYLGRLVDLFDRQYDDVNYPLEEADWEIIRILVDENAGEMDIETVQYIMNVLLSKGMLR